MQLYFILLIFLIVLNLKFVVSYDENTISYENKILRRKRALIFRCKICFNEQKRNILYKTEASSDGELLKIPFYRFGKLDALQANGTILKS